MEVVYINTSIISLEIVLYEYHFDFLESLFLLIPFVVGIGFLCIAVFKNPIVAKKGAKGHKTYIFSKCVGCIVGSFVVILGVIVLSDHIIDYQSKKQLLESNDVCFVEGYTEKYHAMPLEGHDVESFEINGVLFKYTNFEIVNGYNSPAVYGGVITDNGQYLKIKYITDDFGNNTILYIAEIKKR